MTAVPGLPTPAELAAASPEPISDEKYQYVQEFLLSQGTVAETLFEDLLGPFIQRARSGRDVGFLFATPRDYVRGSERLERLIELAEGYQQVIAALKSLRQVVARQEGLPICAGDRPGGGA